MLEKIKALLAEGKTEEANQLMDQYEKENPAAFVEPKHTSVENKALENQKPEEVINLTKVEEVKAETKPQYEKVFAKYLMGRNLDVKDQAVFSEVNNVAYTHQVSNQPILIPETVMSGILEMIEEQHPFYAEVPKLNVTGIFKIKQHTGVKSGFAKFVDEGVPAEAAENEYAEITLTGFELAKLVSISWKLEAMSIEEFIPHIQRLIATEVGDALGYAIFNGKGVDEPKGLLTVLANQPNTPQVLSVTGELTYKEITELRSKIASKFAAGTKFYAKSTTVWNKLANILDGNNRPIFIREVVDGGVGTIFGIPVVEDDGVPENDVVLGNPAAGMLQNSNKPFSIQNETTMIGRATNYQGYTIVDWGVTYTQAFAHLKVTAGE